jgi:hypothetical protein
MIVAWLFIMVLDLSFWKVDIFHMSLDLCRSYLDDHVCRSCFSTYVKSMVLLSCKLMLSTLKWRKTPCALMKHKMRQLLEEQKDFVVIIFSLVSICFQD